MTEEKPNLADLLATPPTTQPSATRDLYRQNGGYTFTAEFDPNDPNRQDITMSWPDKLMDEKDWSAAIKEMNGPDIPEGYRVRLVEMRHQTHGWARSGQGQDAVTKPTWWYRFAVEPVISTLANVDDLVDAINRRKNSYTNLATGESVFHFLGGDLQLGKIDGDNTEGIVDRVIGSLEKAAAELKVRRKVESIGTAHLAWLGDCIEGNVSQKGRNMWRTHLTVTEQVRLFRRIMMYGVDLFAPLVERVEIDVVNGNHDEMQRFQTTRPDDGHATEAAISLADALELNKPVYGHVSIFVPPIDASYMTREIGSSVFTLAHGHQWSRGKAWDWWSKQTFNFQQPGASHFLLHGHFHAMGLGHSMGIDTKRDRTIICVPTFESESTWWKEKTGDVALTGAITMTTQNGEFSRLSVV